MELNVIQNLGFHALLAALLILIIAYILISRPKRSNLPPVPERPYPFLGHAPMLAKGPRQKMKEWGDKTGDIFSFYSGGELNIVLNSFELMKEALVKQASIFSDRPLPNHESFIHGGGKGIIMTSGQNWKEQRTVSLSILRAFGMGKNSLAEKVEEEADAFLTELKELNGKPNNIRTLISNCVANVVCNIVIGERFQLGDPDFVFLLDALDEMVTLFPKVAIFNTFPLLRHFPGDPFKVNKFIENFHKLWNFFTQRFIEPLSQTVDSSEPDCFIIAYLQEMKKRENSSNVTHLDIESLTRCVMDLFAGGSETTSTTLLWFTLEMLHNPNVLSKIQKEIDEVVGSERRPNMQDRSKMNYLNATIMEIQRKSSIVPFSVPHLCNQTTTLGGYNIPKGAVILQNLDSVLLNEKIWGDPLEFRPERFLSSSGELLTFEEFIPFSLGRRFCLGESLARMELFLFVSHICQTFDIRPVEDGKLPPLKEVFGATAVPEAFTVRFIERSEMMI